MKWHDRRCPSLQPSQVKRSVTILMPKSGTKPLNYFPPESVLTCTIKTAYSALKTKSRLMDFRHFHHLVTAEPFLESWFWKGRTKFPLKAIYELMVALLLAQGGYATCRGTCYWGWTPNTSGIQTNITVSYGKCFTRWMSTLSVLRGKE